jgi:hypothetical protein
MRRFGLTLDDDMYDDFYRMFPDHGLRTSVLRRCVHRMVKRAKEVGGILPQEITEAADKIIKEETGK